jgi:hypothetical protein
MENSKKIEEIEKKPECNNNTNNSYVNYWDAENTKKIQNSTLSV